VAFPVTDKRLKERIIAQLEAFLIDTAQSWLLDADGHYHRPEASEHLPVQTLLMEGGV